MAFAALRGAGPAVLSLDSDSEAPSEEVLLEQAPLARGVGLPSHGQENPKRKLFEWEELVRDWAASGIVRAEAFVANRQLRGVSGSYLAKKKAQAASERWDLLPDAYKRLSWRVPADWAHRRGKTPTKRRARGPEGEELWSEAKRPARRPKMEEKHPQLAEHWSQLKDGL